MLASSALLQVGDAEFLEHFARMFTEDRRRPEVDLTASVYSVGPVEAGNWAHLRMVNRVEGRQVGDLRIGSQLIELLFGSERHVRLSKYRKPVLARLFSEDRIQD